MGSNTYTFTVTISAASSAPTIGSVTITHIPGDVPTAWGVYLQGKSKVKITVSGVSAATGSTISTYKFAGGGYSWSSATETSYTTGFLTAAGTNTFTVTVTDSRGLTASKSVSIAVTAYEAPKILSMSAFRSLQSGAVSETGAYITFRITTSYSAINDNNTRKILVAFKRLGDTAWSTNYNVTGDGGWVIPANIEATDEMPYQIRIIHSDTFTSVTQVYDVEGTKYTMYFPSGGRNVSIGMAGTRTDAFEISSSWKIYHGSTDLMTKISGVKPIAEGGTGATTAATALTNLGAAAASHVHAASAITSGVLPVARGGTGASALTANYALVSNASGNIGTSGVTATQLSYLSGATSNIQTQINSVRASIPKIAYGSTNINGSTAAYITYSGFSTVPKIVVTYSSTAANWAGDNGAIKVYSKTTTGAYIIVGGSFATSRAVDWIAVGT